MIAIAICFKTSLQALQAYIHTFNIGGLNMTITAYRKQLEQQGYKTKRLNIGGFCDYFAFKDGQYYRFYADNNGYSKIFKLNINEYKDNIKKCIINAFN